MSAPARPPIRIATNAPTRAAGEGSAESGASLGRSIGTEATARILRAVQVVAVVPTYNEAETLAELVDLLRKAVTGIRVLVVDDDSPDGTADVARRLAVEHGDVDLLV